MTRLIMIILVAISALQVHGQEHNTAGNTKPKKERARLDRGPAIYITTSTGLNNNTAPIGFNFELPINEHVTIDAGPGTGTWNWKVYAGAKYYLKPAQRGFAFGAGFTYATGTYHHWYDATTIYGDHRSLQFNKNPQTNIMFAAYKYWNLGRQYNRIYAELGWSVDLTSGDKVTQVSGPRATDESKDRIASAAPGGPILAVGVSFGIH